MAKKKLFIDYYDDKKWGRKREVRRSPFNREKRVIDILKSLPIIPKHFLDIGCGNGYFMELVKDEIGCSEIIGIENSQYQTNNKKNDLNIIQADIETSLNNVVQDNHFDCIYLGEVIEHVFNPDLIIRICNKKLKKGGILILSTPNLNSWYNRIMFLIGYQPLFYEVSTEDSNIGYGALSRLKRDNLPVGHVRIFNVHSIRELLKKEGFVVSKIQGSPFESFPIVLRLVDTLIGTLITSFSSDLIVIAFKKR